MHHGAAPEQMEQDSLELAVQAIEQGAAEDVEEAIGMPSNGRVITNSLIVRGGEGGQGRMHGEAVTSAPPLSKEVFRACAQLWFANFMKLEIKK